VGVKSRSKKIAENCGLVMRRGEKKTSTNLENVVQLIVRCSEDIEPSKRVEVTGIQAKYKIHLLEVV
jgi:hypothetical protein